MNLPGFNADSGAVSKYPLTNTSRGRIIHALKEAIFNRRSIQVKNPVIEKRVKEPGLTWRELVTLIFDTEIEQCAILLPERT
ncbi:TPA: hypothetical protein N5N76_002872 [Enterobacter asburiae]|nr:hypothetical protein [Enterobacter asburiae]